MTQLFAWSLLTCRALQPPLALILHFKSTIAKRLIDQHALSNRYCGPPTHPPNAFADAPQSRGLSLSLAPIYTGLSLQSVRDPM